MQHCFVQTALLITYFVGRLLLIKTFAQSELFVYIVVFEYHEIEEYEVRYLKKKEKNTNSNFIYSSLLSFSSFFGIFGNLSKFFSIHFSPPLFINIKNQHGESGLKFGIWTVVEAWLISMNDYALFPRKHGNVGHGFWKRPTWEREWGFLRRWYVTYEAREIPWACWLTNVGKEDGVDRFSLSPELYILQFRENREFASVIYAPRVGKLERNVNLACIPLFIQASIIERWEYTILSFSPNFSSYPKSIDYLLLWKKKTYLSTIYKNSSPSDFSFLSIVFHKPPLSITVHRMRIDLETHYSVHPLPSPPLLSKNETYFEACCFVSPPPPPPRRKEEALDEKQISIFAAIIAPLPPSCRQRDACSISRTRVRKRGGRYCRWQSTTVGQRNELYRAAGIFHRKDLVRQREKTSQSWHLGLGFVLLDGSLLSLFLFLSSCSLVDLASIRASERSIDLITVNLSLSILGDQILVRFFQPMNDCTIQKFLNVCVRLLLLLLLFLSLFFFFCLRF